LHTQIDLVNGPEASLTAPPTFLVLQHVVCEPPGAYEDELIARGARVCRVQLGEGEQPPRDWAPFAGIIAMGGPMGAYEGEQYPWLLAELALIREAVNADVPFWGVCLGAQLLAASLGASVGPGDAPEIGVLEVSLSEAAAADPVFGRAPSSFAVLQWHSDTYELPAGSVRLASSAAYPEQAFRIHNAYGLQFHVEVPTDLLEQWGELPAYARSLESALGPGALEPMVNDWRATAPTTLALARKLFGAWLEEVVGLPALSGDWAA
jgi:GMP synthase (glutamine-hydrolysing)